MIDIIFDISAQDFTDGTYDYRGCVCFTVTYFNIFDFSRSVEFKTIDGKIYTERKDAEYLKRRTKWKYARFEDENNYQKMRIRIGVQIDESVEIPYHTSVGDRELAPAFIECCFDVKEIKKCLNLN